MTVPLFTTFVFLAVATLGLAGFRLIVLRTKGDGCIHLAEFEAMRVEQQETAARRLKTIDVCGKTLTVLTVAAGLAAYVVWWIGA